MKNDLTKTIIQSYTFPGPQNLVRARQTSNKFQPAPTGAGVQTMIKFFKLTILFFFIYATCFAQGETESNVEVAQLKLELANAVSDTSQILLMADLSYVYAYTTVDSSLLFGQKALKLSAQIDFARGKINALLGLGNLYLRQGDYPKGLEHQLQALQLSEAHHFEREKAISLMEMGYTYQNLFDFPRSMDYLKRSKEIYRKTVFDTFKRVENEMGISNVYMATNHKDSALACMMQLYNDRENHKMLQVILESLGNIYSNTGNYAKASVCLYQAVALDIERHDPYSLIWAYHSMAKLYQSTKQTDSCISYAKKGFLLAQKIGLQDGILMNSLLLSGEYEPVDTKEALYYRKKYDAANQKVYGPDKVLALQKTITAEQDRQRQLEADRVAEKNRRMQYLFAGGIIIAALIALLFYRNSVQQRKAKKVVEEKNKVIEQTLSNLKAAQSQLIQSEKMASLGELTAGIAHEIQNPLNFVNNFSDVNKELLFEMKDEMDKGNIADAKEIANDVIGNEEKINHHGKRADAIVKGMLQHSQSGKGVKEPTDINKLADEYLRLAYNGLRAKDKVFNATLKTDYDEGIGNINIVPQDIGRVLLNLYNNAFYTVKEKSSFQNLTSLYEPAVSVSTKKQGDKVLISVQDNGNGISQNIVDKIFQPFFTTKPTGQGTGLGLSLAYDIIKAHGGELKVSTKENEETEFVIQLPTA